jgi:hypothetical protein
MAGANFIIEQDLYFSEYVIQLCATYYKRSSTTLQNCPHRSKISRFIPEAISSKIAINK